MAMVDVVITRVRRRTRVFRVCCETAYDLSMLADVRTLVHGKQVAAVKMSLFVSLVSVALCVMMTGCTAPDTSPDNMATTDPVSSSEDRAAAAGWGSGTWLDQHESINRIGKTSNPELVFLGDSITQSWGGPGRTVGAPAADVWDEFFGAWDAASFGISGDRTQHILWRIDHGNFDDIDPEVVVLMIGTNNLVHDSAADIASGIEAIVERLDRAAPNATILLCGIVRGASSDDPLRQKAERVNGLVQPLDALDRVRVIDLPSRFYDANGQANPELVRGDFVHFTKGGYRAWAELLQPHLEELLDGR